MFNSNSFYDDRPVRVRHCDSPGCTAAGDYRAPKNRELTDYHWFCVEHVREYNQGWDYFAGMKPDEIENYNRSATVWERPSWPMGDFRQREQDVRDALHREFFADMPGPDIHAPPSPMTRAEREALATLEMAGPASFNEIKAQYKSLVKKHHPDINGGSRAAEEKFKSIHQAFTLLKEIHAPDDN